MKTANNSISNAATPRNRALVARAALLGLLLAAAGASHAEAGRRICGIVAQDRNDTRWTVGFVMKVNKEDNWSCNDAIERARRKFNEVGGANRAGANRIWRRLTGSGAGPFSNSIAVYVFSKQTCEGFARMTPQHCEGMVLGSNTLYSFAGTTRRTW